MKITIASKQSIFQSSVIVIICLFFSFSTSLNFLGYDNKRIAEIILLNTVLFLIILNSKENIRFLFFEFSNYKRITLAVIISLALLSSSKSIDHTNAFLELSLLLTLLVASLYIGSIIQVTVNNIVVIVFALLTVAALIYEINFFSGFLASFIENIPLVWPEPFSNFANVRFFNQYQIWSISLLPLPILLFPLLDKRLRVLVFIIACGWVVLLFASTGRGIVVSITMAMLMTAIIFKSHAKALLMLMLTTLALGGCGYFILFKLLPDLLNSHVTLGWDPVEQLANPNRRLELWRYALQYIKENPLLGIGPMHYAYYPGPANAHPHNSILQWACEMGIPSTLLVIYLVFSGLCAWVKKFYRLQADNKRYVSKHLWIALFCSMLSGLIYSLFSGVIIMPLSQMMMVLIAGLMFGLYFHDVTPKCPSKLEVFAYKMVATVTLITLIYTVLPSLIPRLNNQYEELARLQYPMIAPRFWELGGIPQNAPSSMN